MLDKDKLEIADLHRRLQSLLDRQPTEGRDEITRLLHEIELELQNRQLHEAQVELKDSQKRYTDLYDFAPVGYLTLDCRGLIIEANLKAADLLGQNRHRLSGKPLTARLAAGQNKRLYGHLQQVFSAAADSDPATYVPNCASTPTGRDPAPCCWRAWRSGMSYRQRMPR